MSRLSSRLLLLFLLFGVVVVVVVVRAKQAPNIIFIVSDDLGYDDLGFQSHQILTPAINGLKSEGQFLQWYYGQPNCSPTRSALLTGKYPIHTGILTWIHPANAIGTPVKDTMIPKFLAKYGSYRTHAVGKWHAGFYKWEMTPTFRGFESFYGYYGGGEDYYTHRQGAYFDFRDDVGVNCGRNCSRVAIDAFQNYSTFEFTNRAIDIIKNHSMSHKNKYKYKYTHALARNDDEGEAEDEYEPLFLYLAYQSVHAPAEVPNSYVTAYNGIINNKARKIYAGMLSCMDEGIKNITDVLQAHGYLDNNTIIVFTSDNGGLAPIPSQGVGGIGGSNYPLRGGKQSIWEGGTRLTGFVWGTTDVIPVHLRGSNYTQLFHVVDWYRTLLSMADIEVQNNSEILNYITAHDFDGVDQWSGIIDDYAEHEHEHENDHNNGMGMGMGLGTRAVVAVDPYFAFRDTILYGYDIYNGYPSNNSGYRKQWMKVFNQSGGYPDDWYQPKTDTRHSNSESNVRVRDEHDYDYDYDYDYGYNNASKNARPEEWLVPMMMSMSAPALSFSMYNISEDYTEHFDISEGNPELVTQLIQEMDALLQTGVAPPYDPNCPPITHPTYPVVGAVWEPWC